MPQYITPILLYATYRANPPNLLRFQILGQLNNWRLPKIGLLHGITLVISVHHLLNLISPSILPNIPPPTHFVPNSAPPLLVCHCNQLFNTGLNDTNDKKNELVL
jgi:hypothetical protein